MPVSTQTWSRKPISSRRSSRAFYIVWRLIFPIPPWQALLSRQASTRKLDVAETPGPVPQNKPGHEAVRQSFRHNLRASSRFRFAYYPLAGPNGTWSVKPATQYIGLPRSRRDSSTSHCVSEVVLFRVASGSDVCVAGSYQCLIDRRFRKALPPLEKGKQ